MTKKILHSLPFIVRTAVVTALTLISVATSCVAGNYFRASASFSYAHERQRAEYNTKLPSNATLNQAQDWLGGGEAEALKESHGFSPDLGIGYRYTYKLLQLDLGLGLAYRYLVNKPYPVKDIKAAATDDTGLPYTGFHTWNERNIRAQHLAIQLPVMIGFEYKNVYALAGIKANLDLWGTAREKGSYSLRGKYDYFMAPFADIDGHGFVADEPYQLDAEAMSMAWDMRACIEIGYCLNGEQEVETAYRTKEQPRYYLGIFAEGAFAGTQKAYMPLIFGVRFTALIPLPEPKKCNCLKP